MDNSKCDRAQPSVALPLHSGKFTIQGRCRITNTYREPSHTRGPFRRLSRSSGCFIALKRKLLAVDPTVGSEYVEKKSLIMRCSCVRDTTEWE